MATQNALKELIKKVKFAPSRDWVNAYFDLMKQVLDITGLRDGDSRLVMPLSKTRYQFPMSINSRYVIASLKGKTETEIGLIFTPYYQDIPKLRHKKVFWQFSNGRSKGDPPYFLRFNNLQEVISLLDSSEQARQCWHDALRAEVIRAKGGRHSGHESTVYKLVTDKLFRAEILDMAFPEIPSTGQKQLKARNFIKNGRAKRCQFL